MSPFPFKKLGVIPYVRSGNELTAATEPTAAPSTYLDEAFFSMPILMQGQSPECGGFSPAFALAYLLNAPDKLSGSFLYAFEKTVDGVPNEEGTTITAVGEAAQNVGACLYPLFPDDGSATTDPQGSQTPYSDATAQAIQDAATRAGWIPLMLTDLSWSGLQAAIAKYKCVIVEAQVGNEWWTAPDGANSWAEADILPIRPPAQVVDGHFFVLGGQYDGTATWFANSWSTEWGHNGFGYLGPDYVPFIKNAIVFYKPTPSVQTVVNHPTLTPQEKSSIIQQIIDDIQQAVTLIQKEV
jgi:hypothetical protein